MPHMQQTLSQLINIINSGLIHTLLNERPKYVNSLCAEGIHSCFHICKSLKLIQMFQTYDHICNAMFFYGSHYHYNFTTLCPGLPGWVGTRRRNHSGLCWSRDDGVTVASAEPYASYLHFAPEDNHASTLISQIFMGRMPFLTPNQQHQSTEGHKHT